MEGHGEKADLRSELVRLAARLIVEEGLEGEAADASPQRKGRERHPAWSRPSLSVYMPARDDIIVALEAKQA